ncbi:hypothetical protein L4C33_14210 [Vibrio makurazakiensis]|uniref:hypothetical protein n=1 Tax=Vibrio makurazakiensis TaxID=2910250 RepID=UPI003D09C0D9
MKNTLSTVHRTAAIMATLLIFSFFTSSLLVELFGTLHQVLVVKTAILYGVGILIVLMALTGITGAKLAPNVKKGPIARKKKRMPFVAMNGLLILLPAAIYLQHLASVGQFDVTFYSIQVIELIAGFINLSLMVMNIRDARTLKQSPRLKERKV